jgi:hypothetical protein
MPGLKPKALLAPAEETKYIFNTPFLEYTKYTKLLDFPAFKVFYLTVFLEIKSKRKFNSINNQHLCFVAAFPASPARM